MSIELPQAIADYFAADREHGAEGVSQCFTENAVVRDEGNTYVGREAIRQWKADASSKYRYTVEPIAIEAADGRTVVTGRLVGTFPGSPVDLRYAFFLDGARIANLEIGS